MWSLSRVDRSVFSQWWWTVDRVLVAAVLLLIAIGFVFSMAASPPVAVRLGLDQFFFVKRQLIFLVPALGIMFGASLLDARQMRRICLAVFIISFVLMVYAIFGGVEVKGARRWVEIAGFRLQPSEFAKTSFVVLAAWLFSEGGKSRDIPGAAIATALLIGFCSLLLLQPDFGQSMLIALVWGTLFFMAGMPWIWIVLLTIFGIAGIALGYALLPHVSDRIDRFFDPGSGDTYQVDTALASIIRGGWFGRGPGEGVVKNALPDSHTDFVFAVAAEEFGILVCLFVVGLFAFIVLRVMIKSYNETETFTRFASAGLIIMFGLQALINMAVNLQLLPAKGMTLPFISTGGSSLLSMSLALGMVMGLTRRRKDREALRKFETRPVMAQSSHGVAP